MFEHIVLHALGEVDKALQIMKDIVLDYEELRDSARAFLVSYYRIRKL